MSLASFLSELLEHGRPRVPDFGPPDDADHQAAARALTEFEQLWRLELPGGPPDFDPDAALWAATLVFRACQFVVFRDLPAELIEKELSAPCQARRGPSADYSADLAFRFLPDVLHQAKSAAEKDPLVERLRGLATAWPLSSAGVANLGPVDVSSFAGHPTLLRLYVDRVLAHGDESRLEDERVRDAARRAVGLHPTLAGKLASAFAPEKLSSTP